MESHFRSWRSGHRLLCGCAGDLLLGRVSHGRLVDSGGLCAQGGIIGGHQHRGFEDYRGYYQDERRSHRHGHTGMKQEPAHPIHEGWTVGSYLEPRLAKDVGVDQVGNFLEGHRVLEGLPHLLDVRELGAARRVGLQRRSDLLFLL